jgi:A/G-specific adenine glycosylase
MTPETATSHELTAISVLMPTRSSTKSPADKPPSTGSLNPRHTTRARLTSKDRRFRRVILDWGHHHTRAFPWRDRSDPYAVMIGEILLQRTRAENVAPVYEDFLARWPDARSLGDARLQSIQQVIYPLGLPNRAETLKRLGRELSAYAQVPRDPRKLMILPGVGRYAAHAVPVFASHRNLPVVDWVIARVLRRYFGLSVQGRPSTDDNLWRMAEDLVAPGRARDLWLGTLDFAAAVCLPRPRCDKCALSGACTYFATMPQCSFTKP